MTVKIYTTPTCQWCVKTKEFFKKHKVRYTEKDVSKSSKNAREMVEISGQRGTPVIVVNKEVIVGFYESKLKKALKIK